MDMKLPACPVETTLSLIGDKWKVLILRDLLRAPDDSENCGAPSAALARRC